MRGHGLWGVHRDRLRARPESGAVAVEFALVLPILVMLVFGIFTTGLAYSDHLAVTNAVREGARLGAAIKLDTASPSTWANSVQTRVHQVYFNTASSFPLSDICVQLVDSTGGVLATPTTQGSHCGNAPTTPTMDSGTCAVKVWAAKPETISILVYSDMNFNIGAESVAYYGRNVTGCTATP